MIRIGIFGTSCKKHEKRIPLHPAFFDKIPNEIKKSLIFEKGYASALGVDDSQILEQFGGVASRADLFEKSDVWILPKPEKEDFKYFKEGKILWGWPHCVQGVEIAQAAIDAKMTLIAWEAMYGGADNTHIFYKNNELAGYAAVQHMMMLTGKTGCFGRPLKAAVLGFGATARGAINSLKSLGIVDITVYSQRAEFLLNAPIESIKYKRMKRVEGSTLLESAKYRDFSLAAEVLSQYDIVVNCVLQDPTNPIMFIDKGQIDFINKQMDIIDISCDKGMGFYFARPTCFDFPKFKHGEYINYYSVDHTPTLYWDSASFEVTKSIIDFIEHFVDGSWMNNPILMKATEIKNGIVLNDKIIKFQNRDKTPPYLKINNVT
ncbi:N(5)-(carboxyethyl)ornithine synthase [Pseudoalteromonas sp. BDTF-M6]|uniref:N(5)-(carboxyethyl)ornithine synthase n=1 Tax=Pseudoalteromonas sp. BDTF-M6 TaxID=2796132 RepID=UPI001BAFD28F|nr:N(5)-(carboxyethyl)ornithine synthase [Pseudoalteromonas sp. BDTF-M6]MBS3798481.1 N(5)-(carboxyethyl)ornithine synthase [Pseudoalteromonas sp. BDTF-M6]